MNKSVRRVTALLMTVAILLSVTACGGGGGKTSTVVTTEETVEEGTGSSASENGTGSSSGSGGTTTTTTTQNGGQAMTKSEETKAKNSLKGYTFTFASGWMTLEENIGDNTPLYERLFYERAHQVEKDLGCTIKVIHFTGNAANLKTYVMAGKKVADILEIMPTWIPENIAGGNIQAWENVKGINTGDTSKFLPHITKMSKMNGKTYGLQFLKPAEARYCIMFNKTLLQKSGVDVKNIYNLVRQKKWTWEKLREYAKAATKDDNNDGTNDTWGLIGKYDYLAYGLLSSFGGSLVAKKGGKYVYNLNSTASLSSLDFYDQLVNKDKCVWVANELKNAASYTNVSESNYYKMFNSGKAAFLLWESWVLNQQTKLNANFEYGILPLPLGGSQKNYISPAENSRVLCLTSTNKDLDKVSIIMNALADNFGEYKGDDWYEDIEADYFKNDKKDNLEMYKLILNASSFDVGTSITSLQDAFFRRVVIESIYLSGRTTSPAAAADSYKNTYTDAINMVLNKR